MKRELTAEPDLEKLADWDVEDKPPTESLPSLVSATELYRGQIVTLRPLFQDLLWDGLTMLIARPKAGKSWLTLQLAVNVAGGRKVDGITTLEHGPVLYGAFEEPKARTMARLRKLAPDGDWTENLHFVYDLLPLMGGGSEQLGALIQKLMPRLVVLDTFTALVKAGSKNGSDVFRSQYAEVSRLRKLAEEFGTAIIVVHHMRKGMSDSAIEAVAGTGGIAAAVDTLWQLKRKPEGEATLDVVGRETEERTLAMQFDQEPLGWRILGDDEAQVLNSERRQVLELLREEGPLTPAQIAAELGKSRPAVRMLLKRMKDDLLIKKQGSKYIPTHTMSYSVTESE
jgi:DNA-binding transcriptional ArsR family regulator